MTKEEKKVFSDVALSKYHELIRQQEKDKVDQKKEEEIKSKLQQEELYLRKYNELLKLKPLDKDLQETIKKCERKLEIGHQMIKLKEELSRI